MIKRVENKKKRKKTAVQDKPIYRSQEETEVLTKKAGSLLVGNGILGLNPV